MQYALVFETKEEFDKAAALVEAHRGSVRISANSAEANHSLTARLEAALAMSPLNPQKATVLRAWLATPPSEWSPYPSVVAAFIQAGLAPAEQASAKASAAIRDLSWQVAQTFSKDELAAFDKAIEMLASRSRAAGIFSYRLTPAGREATERFLKQMEGI
jgi:hypothetical protein